jgi:LPXTG-motif cell wall-anchored protein
MVSDIIIIAGASLVLIGLLGLILRRRPRAASDSVDAEETQ